MAVATSTAALIGAAVAAAGTAVSYTQGKKAQKQQKRANEEAKAQSEKALAQQEREFNRKNAKSPNVAAALSANRQATTNQTLLSGAGGVNPGTLELGKNTLLGQ